MATNSVVRKSSNLSLTRETRMLTCTVSLGTLGITLGLPIACYAAAFLCNDITGCPVPSILTPSTLTLRRLKEETGWPDNGIQGLASLRVTGWVLAYYMLSLTLYSFLPAEEPEGVVLKSGGRLKYRFNGMAMFNQDGMIQLILM